MRAHWLLLLVTLTAWTGCESNPEGASPSVEQLDNPISIAAHPDGRYLYISNAGFERKFTRGSVNVYDTEQHRFLSNVVADVGLFSGQVVTRPYSDEEGVRRVSGLTVTRDPSTLVQFSIDAAKGDNAKHIASIKTDTDFGGSPFAAAPYSIAVDDDGIMVTHLNSGVLSRWHEDPKKPERVVFGCSLNLPEGASLVARHPSTGHWYVTDRLGGRIQIVEEQAAESVSSGDTLNTGCSLIVVGSIELNTVSTRGLGFSADGSLLYVSSVVEEAIRIYDTTVGRNGVARRTLLHIQPVGSSPGSLTVAGCRPCECISSAPGASCPQNPQREGGPLDAVGEGLVYISTYGDGHLVVFDPSSMSVVARIDVGDTPQDMAIMKNSQGQVLGYVTNFKGNSISIVDLTPGSESRFSLIAVVD